MICPFLYNENFKKVVNNPVRDMMTNKQENIQHVINCCEAEAHYKLSYFADCVEDRCPCFKDGECIRCTGGVLELW